MLLFTSRYGTAIVAIVTREAITLGVDSKATDLAGLSNDTVCKIYQANQYLYALGGLQSLLYYGSSESSERNAYAYKPYDFIADILKTGNELKLIEDTIHRQWARYIFSFLNAIKKHNEKDFTDILKELRISSLFITGMENGVPCLLVVNAVIKDTAQGPRCEVTSNKVTTADEAVHRDGCLCYAYVTEATYHQIDKELACKQPREEIERLIQLEFVNNEKFTGPPIDLYKITSNGLVWMNRKDGVPIRI